MWYKTYYDYSYPDEDYAADPVFDYDSRAKDGFCYMAGGKESGPKCAVWKIEEDKMVPQQSLHLVETLAALPAHLVVHRDISRSCEYEEQHIKNYYTHEPQNYEDNK